MGTHNLLLALGADVYLEVAAIDPDAAAVSRPRWFGLDNLDPQRGAHLAAWVASTDDIASAAGPELGEVETMEREGRKWRMTLTADGSPPLDGAGPVLIQRSTHTHPASVLPDSGLRLRQLRVRHPAPALVCALLAKIGLAAQPGVTVVHGASSALLAEIDTPSGLRFLGGEAWWR